MGHDSGEWVTFQKNRDTTKGLDDTGDIDERILNGTAWQQYIDKWRYHIMTPMPGTVYGPDDWENADLNDWLATNAPEEYREQNQRILINSLQRN